MTSFWRTSGPSVIKTVMCGCRIREVPGSDRIRARFAVTRREMRKRARACPMSVAMAAIRSEPGRIRAERC